MRARRARPPDKRPQTMDEYCSIILDSRTIGNIETRTRGKRGVHQRLACVRAYLSHFLVGLSVTVQPRSLSVSKGTRLYSCRTDERIVDANIGIAEIVDADIVDSYSANAYIVNTQLPGATSSPNRESYPSDLTDEEWRKVRKQVQPRSRRGRKRAVDEREILNAIFYVLRAGCSWRMLPHDLPPWPTVYYYYSQWTADGTLDEIRRSLGR